MSRILFYIAALGAIGLAILGAFLPLLPTTPFLLAAAFFSAKASPRLHQWLLNHRVFGALIRDYQQHQAVSPAAFKKAVILLWLSLALSAWLVPYSGVRLLLLLIGLLATTLMWRARRNWYRRCYR